ncbi:MAG: glutamate racemase [Chitinophagales bacterium]|jgi:glutamate racemase|nr:glutamate racemase [Bacteroidota bacterium]MBP8915162.1 glutamate racemase [Chitinophagales bacterium]MBP9219854.1 glutamate racemase [Chitinophagales bacterium]MBP9794392.1 glutamate racemase [Chitinophagales bacterium]
MQTKFPIGVFDSGYGGLTVLKEFVKELPEYDFIYLGDNGRAPYGNRSFETVYEYTLESVQELFDMGCKLVILACNTASAKALRTIQQIDLPLIDPDRRVLGVIRPTSEIAGEYTKTNHIGIFATTGTVLSGSYVMEINKFFPDVHVYQEACPMWVPLIENNEHNKDIADPFVQQHVNNLLEHSDEIDTIILGCTHYPLLIPKIKKYLPPHIQVISQGEIVAKGLVDYLHRHPEMEILCSKNSKVEFYTTDSTENFDQHAGVFFGSEVKSKYLHI